MSKLTKSDKKKTTKTMFLIFLLYILCTTFNVSPAKSSLPVHNLNTGLDYATIQEAITAPETLEGHIIKVDAGIFKERVIVYKDNLTIVGDGPSNTIIDSEGIGEVVYITANNVHLSGFTIKNGGWVGIYLDHASHNTLVGNTIADNSDYGIYLDGSDDNTIRENTVTNNWRGIFFWYSNNNLIYHNNFVNNTVQAYSEMSINAWDNGCEGNYWSNYNGSDFDGDCVGDEFLPWEGVDYYPLMNLYWNPADINHDLKVNIEDLALAGWAFGSFPGHERWNPHADITGTNHLEPDGKINIEDLALIGINFGKIAS